MTLSLPPGANAKAISLAFVGARNLRIDDSGNLILKTGTGEVTLEKPNLYQEIDQARKKIEGGYVLHANRLVSFRVGEYDASKPLIIDPVLTDSTYLGGSSDDIVYAIAGDSQGNAYVTGRTYSTNFPTLNPYRSTNSGGRDIFVAKLNSTGTALLYSTYIGGSGDELGFGIAVNSSGEAYVTGWTSSLNFPLVGALQPFYGGGSSDAFLIRLNSTGNSLLYSTYAGGSGADVGTGIALDSARNIYGIGYTNSSNLQLVNAVQPFYAGGYDGFLMEVTASGNLIVFSTYAGGSGDDYGQGIAVDASGYIYAIGETNSTDLYTVNALQPFNAGGAYDAFIGKLTPSGRFDSLFHIRRWQWRR